MGERESTVNCLEYTLLFQTGEPQETQSSISTEAIFKRGNAEKRRGRDSGSRRERERHRESGGLELDEGHISSH